MWRTVATVLGIICLIVALAGVVFGMWWIGREIHYRVAYKDMVQQTVREMVKEEALR